MPNLPLLKTIKRACAKPANRPALLLGAIIALVAGGGCATSAVLSDTDYNRPAQSRTVKQTLVSDRLVAFGRPAEPIPNMPTGKVVIIGEQKSYVLTNGGEEMVSILTTLDPSAIQVENDMTFQSANDGYFNGKMRLSYAKFAHEHSASDKQYFVQHRAVDCTRVNDQQLGIERYCFDVPITGAIYPQVRNFASIRSQYRALTKPYPITIYTTGTTTQSAGTRSLGDVAKTLIALPFAIAFDAIAIPIVIVIAVLDDDVNL